MKKAQTKDRLIALRVSTSIYESWKSQANLLGITMSAWIHLRCIGVPTAPVKQSVPRGATIAAKGAKLPDRWTPARSEANVEAERQAQSAGVVLRTELLCMRDWAASTGTTRKDWDAQWRNWLRKAVRQSPMPKSKQGSLESVLSIARGG